MGFVLLFVHSVVEPDKKLDTLFWYCIVVAMNAYLRRVPAETLTSLQTAFLTKFPVMFQVT